MSIELTPGTASQTSSNKAFTHNIQPMLAALPQKASTWITCSLIYHNVHY